MQGVKSGQWFYHEVCTSVSRQTSKRFRAPQSRCLSSRHRQLSAYPSKQAVWGYLVALGFGSVFLSGAVGFYELHADAASAPIEFEIEKTKKRVGLSKEENRDSISSQHLQIKRSVENPGLYVWGSNSGRVASPSEENIIRLPRRVPFFDGMLLRDLKLDRNFGAAITENGDLLQWGTQYAPDVRTPVPTLTGKGLVSIEISKDRIIALSSSGKVYSIPVSRSDQASGSKPSESSWIPFFSSTASISYRTLEPPNSAYSEKVSSISSGLQHVLLLTSTGRVFSAASSSDEFPARGQMGVSGLTWTSRPAGPYDQPHEINTLRGFDISAVATGDYHSLALDREGRVFAFGDNSSGQLGFDPSAESPFIDAPSLLPLQRLYAGTGLSPRITSIAAGGSNSFFTVDGTRVAKPGDDSAAGARSGLITGDTWSCGQGILGTLGTGRWTHVQGTPTKIKALSGLFEYDETANRVVPIRLKRLSVGSTHASATMDNVTHVAAGTTTILDGENETNWGADVLWWGGNEFCQLGMGKRNNVALPSYIAPLDHAADLLAKGKKKGAKDHRFQITPKHTVTVNGKRVQMEQRVECGRGVSAVYSAI